MKAQASLEAIISAAAIVAFLTVLAAAALEYAASANALSAAMEDRIRAEMLALSINIHAADARLSTFTAVPLNDCVLEEHGVRCSSGRANTTANNSGRGRYEFFESLPI